MFTKKSDDGYRTPLPGIRMKTTVYGEKTLMTEFRLEKDSVLPLHAHPYEQTGYLVSGRLVLIVGGERYAALPGDSWCVRGGIEHGAEVVEDAVALEVFSPVREDYLPRNDPGSTGKS